MAFIDTTMPAAADGPVRAMYERQQASFGYVPNYAKVFSHRPELMSRWASLLAGVRGSIEPRRFELVTLAAARALRSSYCSLAAMVAFAEKIAVDASSVTAGDVGRLKALGFADDEIFDIVATVAARAFFTKLLDGLGVEPDATYASLDEPLRKALTVGRPIGFQAPEQIASDDD
jgi:alkylhydroperoxidase family enzyme